MIVLHDLSQHDERVEEFNMSHLNFKGYDFLYCLTNLHSENNNYNKYNIKCISEWGKQEIRCMHLFPEDRDYQLPVIRKR